MAKNVYDVFISHSEKDRPIARQLAKALETRGINAWTDSRIETGKWKNQVEKALRQSKFFLLLLSPDFLTSPWANFELGVALGRADTSEDTFIIPLTLKGFRKQSLPKSLRNFHVIDGKDISSTKAAEKVVEVMGRLPSAK